MSPSREELDWASKFVGKDLSAYMAPSGKTASAPGVDAKGDSSAIKAMLLGVSTGRAQAQQQQALTARVRFLETLRPVEGQPDKYAAEREGKDVTLPRSDGDKARAEFADYLRQAVAVRQATCGTVRQRFKDCQAHGISEKMAALFVDDEVTDIAEAERLLSTSAFMIAGMQYAAVVDAIAGALIHVHRAHEYIDIWQGEVVSRAGTIAESLKFVEDTAFAFDKQLAKVAFGPAAGKFVAAGLDALQTGAEIGGQALAGDEIEWREKIVSLALHIAMDMMPGADNKAEEGIKEEIEQEATKALTKEVSGENLEKIAKAIAETVVDKFKEELTKSEFEPAKGETEQGDA